MAKSKLAEANEKIADFLTKEGESVDSFLFVIY